ncbi:peptide methionine sulfoxide reductase MsrA [Baffinella frigidus]|nr:peptide methionine sulfoxide reductase MsrA [Cryptophyta sp. CCMP2293]
MRVRLIAFSLVAFASAAAGFSISGAVGRAGMGSLTMQQSSISPAAMAVLGGVKRTRVGYCGGTQSDPTYRKVCSDKAFDDWAEVIQIDFAPEEISYSDVLSHFWKSHDASGAGGGKRQYMSAIFAHGDEQGELAERMLAARPPQQRSVGDEQGELAERMLAARPKRVATVVEPATDFYQAEAYHQKWLLQRKGSLFKALKILSIEGPEGLIDSKAASLLNVLHQDAAHGHLSAPETMGALEELVAAGELSEEALGNVRRRMQLG